MAEPYISVVVAARNDNHGGNMLGRMQAFVDSWMVQSERYGLPSEIVAVEWNPPEGRPRLREALQWPDKPGPCEVRFIEVSRELHASLSNSEAIRLHQMIAKNAGIRRARGEFVLATNLDIVFSPEFMRFVAERRLERGAMYRMDRYDVASDIPNRAAGMDALLEHCRNHVLRVFAAEGTFAFEAGELRSDEDGDIADTGIGFGRGWMPMERLGDLRYRWIAAEARILYRRPSGAAMKIEAEVGPSQGSEPLLVEVLDESGTVVAVARAQGRCRLRLHFPEGAASGIFTLRVRGRNIPLFPEIRLLHLRVHELRWEACVSGGANWKLDMVESRPGVDWSETLQAPIGQTVRRAACLHHNASGDFTLLAREDWLRLRGYAEFPIWPLHLDTLFCYAAHHAGIREVILRDPMCMFHIEHLSGAGWTPEGEESLNARVQGLRVPVLDFSTDVRQWVQRMRRLDAPVIFNLGNWGLGEEELPCAFIHQ